MKQKAIALLSGLLFGFGLGLSQMVDRERVLGFLDIAGQWDPTLLFVLGGAVGVTVVAFRFVLRLPHPFLGDRFYLPTKTIVDCPLLVGGRVVWHRLGNLWLLSRSGHYRSDIGDVESGAVCSVGDRRFPDLSIHCQSSCVPPTQQTFNLCFQLAKSSLPHLHGQPTLPHFAP